LESGDLVRLAAALACTHPAYDTGNPRKCPAPRNSASGSTREWTR
jgi:hypothetical protein